MTGALLSLEDRDSDPVLGSAEMVTGVFANGLQALAPASVFGRWCDGVSGLSAGCHVFIRKMGMKMPTLRGCRAKRADICEAFTTIPGP